MGNRGFVHIFSLLVIVTVLMGGLYAVSAKQEQAQKKAVGRVLSSSDSEVDSSGTSGSAGSSDKSDSEKKLDEAQKETAKKVSEWQKESKSKSGSSDKSKVESRTGNSKTKIETENGKSEVEIESSDGAKFKSKVEDDGRIETKIRTGSLRIEIKSENGRLVTKVKDENNEEVELEDEEEKELFDDFNDELDDDDIRIASDSAGFIQKGNKVRTNFPLSVNPITGELFVTTPAGVKVVTILPAVAIQNMIAAGIMTRVETPPSPPAVEPPSGTDSATVSATVAPTVDGASIEISEFKGKVVYQIDGVRDEKFAGIIPVNIKVKAVVSIENGELLDINQGFFTKLLDLLSF